MNKPTLKATLASIREQRAALAKVRAEADDLDDYLAAIEARAKDMGVRIPMTTAHGYAASGRKTALVVR